MRPIAACLAVAALVLTSGLARAQQQDFSKVEITAEKLAEGVYMLEGAGGNIGVSVGPGRRPPGGRPVRAAHAQDQGRGGGDQRQAHPLRAQHALARRPHGRQREHGRRGRRSSWPTTTCGGA